MNSDKNLPFDKRRSAGYLANHMARLFAMALQQRLKPLGLAPGQFMALLVLWEEEGLTQKDLIARLDVEQATMANTLTRMERDGLIIRRPHPQDGRAQSILLTDKARRLESDAKAHAQAVNQQALSALSEQEISAFLQTLQKVTDTLRDADKDS
ncbi:MarR family winged helix-turn-helix transcriptional regulator [Rhodovibrionaceae bacterium A322]